MKGTSIEEIAKIVQSIEKTETKIEIISNIIRYYIDHITTKKPCVNCYFETPKFVK